MTIEKKMAGMIGAAVLALAVMATPAAAQVGKSLGVVDTNTAPEKDLLAMPHMTPAIVKGLLEKRPYREPGSRTRYEYVLTEMGNALLPVIVALMQWGDTYLRDGDGPLRVVSAETGEPVSVRVTPSGAESLGPEGLAVRINRKA